MTAAYHMTKGKDGVVLVKKKDSHMNLLDKIEFEFDPETFYSTAKGEWGSGSDRLLMFISRMEKTAQTFDLAEIKAATNLSRTSILRLFGTGQFKGRVSNVSTNGRKGLYRVSQP